MVEYVGKHLSFIIGHLSLGIWSFRQDLQDLIDFLFHHFPDESDEMQSASGGKDLCENRCAKRSRLIWCFRTFVFS